MHEHKARTDSFTYQLLSRKKNGHLHDYSPTHPPTHPPTHSNSFVNEHQAHSSSFTYQLLSKKNGHLHDYDHSSLLLHKDCERDHFPQIRQWIAAHEQMEKEV